jgi:multimeric flavodoxin WrbA
MPPPGLRARSVLGREGLDRIASPTHAKTMGLLSKGVRTGQAPPKLSREEFRRRFWDSFVDPAFHTERAAIDRLEAIAYEAYAEGRKAPLREKAGPEFADPEYELSTDWLAARARLKKAKARHDDPAAPGRVLVVCASDRNDGTCPGEISKSFRLASLAADVLRDEARLEVDTLDLSLITSEYGRTIHPCKGCVSTAMPLCHWPCSCYPNHSLGQIDDWMNEIYERFTLAHGVVIVTPVYWYQTPSALKLMIDRLVCADGGNPDPTTTHGKSAEKAKKLEQKGWDYPKHLSGRAYGLVVHGDVAGIESVRHALSDWLEWMGFLPAGAQSQIERYIGYYEPYATSHDTLDKDEALFEEVRNVARAVGNTVHAIREGTIVVPDAKLSRPRPK